MNKRYALLSVYDKTGIVEFAKTLDKLGFKIISTGGTGKVLVNEGIPVVPIEEITGNPESFDGRMKTISFQVESGILFDRTNPTHRRVARQLGIKPIDIVACNLYPFEATKTVENIDVGGPTMIRAAAKNFKNVLVVVDPKDYQSVGKELLGKKLTQKTRRALAGKAFRHLSLYDSLVARFLDKEQFPQELTIPLRGGIKLRYGENPHQEGFVYFEPGTNSPFRNLQRLGGRELSLVNVTDINAGLESLRLLGEGPAAVIIKHNSPCGIALGRTSKEALGRAIESDPESAFGGVIVLNKGMDLATAKVIAAFKSERKSNIDIVAVPSITQDALELLKKVRKSMGIYTFGQIPKKRTNPINIKWIDGGLILQTEDSYDTPEIAKEWKVVTRAKPTPQQFRQMKFAWDALRRIRSNAVIVVDKELPMVWGIGQGQTSRYRSTMIALSQAGKHVKGAILASDSFFPYEDSVKSATKRGIGAIIEQGGSINDQASIDAANKAGIPMVFTNFRAFWH
ncbi:MAG: bifunctional phosphoribosylaminoimidazolecarboxamide formyltransferase/IMP cyclohydrolase [bacterium]|nr:bifunctional phosphoribosylaminoimidazolecarboxamide formyltransferase/IMP cyclohydrolase [bacterium]